jgi:two-component system chemotaxis response regulator CheY
MVLTDMGGTIVEAEDGAEALGIAMCQPPDVVVAEVALRRLDGFTLARLLRREPQTRASAIVLITSSRDAAEIARALDAGADEVIVKPYLPGTLLSAIESARGRRHCSSP